MKNKLLFIVSLLICCTSLLAETTKDTKTAIPAMNTAQRTSIINTTPGLLVYDTDSKCFWLYQKNEWQALANAHLNTAPITKPAAVKEQAVSPTETSSKPRAIYLGFTENSNTGSYAGNNEDCDTGIHF